MKDRRSARNGSFPSHDEIVAAVADYLIGVPIKIIEQKHKVSVRTITVLVRKAGLKTRQDGARASREPLTQPENENTDQFALGASVSGLPARP